MSEENNPLIAIYEPPKTEIHLLRTVTHRPNAEDTQWRPEPMQTMVTCCDQTIAKWSWQPFGDYLREEMLGKGMHLCPKCFENLANSVQRIQFITDEEED